MRVFIRKQTVFAVMAVTVLFALSMFVLPAFAQEAEAEPAPVPWDDVYVIFGGVTIAWASAQMGLLQVLKSIRIGDKLLLGSPGLIWLANAILGVIGMVIAATQAGIPTLAAVIQAVIAVFASSGQYEFMSKTGTGKATAPAGGE